MYKQLYKAYENKKWITSQGEEVKISSMTITHLINCLKLLKRTRGDFHGLKRGYIILLRQELVCRLNLNPKKIELW